MRQLALTVTLLACAASAVAQDPPKFHGFGGYAFVRQTNDQYNLNGFGFSAAYLVSEHVAIKADISRVADDMDTYTFFVFGPELRFRPGAVEPFFHVVFGGMRDSYGGGVLDLSSTEFAYGFGGGLDAIIKRNVGLRLVQADVISNRRSSTFVHDNAVFLRISAGLVVRF
jgi:hypothetical protein